MRECPRCSFLNPDRAEYCIKCRFLMSRVYGEQPVSDLGGESHAESATSAQQEPTPDTAHTWHDERDDYLDTPPSWAGGEIVELPGQDINEEFESRSYYEVGGYRIGGDPGTNIVSGPPPSDAHAAMAGGDILRPGRKGARTRKKKKEKQVKRLPGPAKERSDNVRQAPPVETKPVKMKPVKAGKAPDTGTVPPEAPEAPAPPIGRAEPAVASSKKVEHPPPPQEAQPLPPVVKAEHAPPAQPPAEAQPARPVVDVQSPPRKLPEPPRPVETKPIATAPAAKAPAAPFSIPARPRAPERKVEQFSQRLPEAVSPTAPAPVENQTPVPPPLLKTTPGAVPVPTARVEQAPLTAVQPVVEPAPASRPVPPAKPEPAAEPTLPSGPEPSALPMPASAPVPPAKTELEAPKTPAVETESLKGTSPKKKGRQRGSRRGAAHPRPEDFPQVVPGTGTPQNTPPTEQGHPE